MTILDRYIGKHVIGGSLLALFVLLAVFTLASFVDDLGDVGRGEYTLARALEFVLLTTPRRAFQLFPLAALVGSLLGLGVLAGNSELRVVRAAGVSNARIVGAVMKAGAVLMVGAVLIGEVLAPLSEPVAIERRSQALKQQLATGTRDGLWVREGGSFINIGRMHSAEAMQDVVIYEFDDAWRLRVATRAASARHDGEGWQLEQAVQSVFGPEGVRTQRIGHASWQAFLAPEMVRVVAVTPESLSALGLYRYIGYLQDNGLDSRQFEVALWSKFAYPLATGVMIFLAVPLVLGRLSSAGLGGRVLVGSLLGIGFHVVQQTATAAGVVFSLQPALAVMTPMLVFLAVGVVLLRRVG